MTRTPNEKEFNEGEKLAPPKCPCLGHHFPGVSHMVACCDTPHITQEEYMKEHDGPTTNQ